MQGQVGLGSSHTGEKTEPGSELWVKHWIIREPKHQDLLCLALPLEQQLSGHWFIYLYDLQHCVLLCSGLGPLTSVGNCSAFWSLHGSVSLFKGVAVHVQKWLCDSNIILSRVKKLVWITEELTLNFATKLWFLCTSWTVYLNLS